MVKGFRPRFFLENNKGRGILSIIAAGCILFVLGLAYKADSYYGIDNYYGRFWEEPPLNGGFSLPNPVWNNPSYSRYGGFYSGTFGSYTGFTDGYNPGFQLSYANPYGNISQSRTGYSFLPGYNFGFDAYAASPYRGIFDSYSGYLPGSNSIFNPYSGNFPGLNPVFYPYYGNSYGHSFGNPLSPYPGFLDWPVGSNNPKPPLNNSLKPQPGDEDLTRSVVYLESTEILLLESYPVQVRLHIEGSLPTPCHQLRAVVSGPDEQDRIQVELYSLSDPEVMCIQVLEDFEENLSLGSYRDGSYTVWINGEQAGEFSI